MEMTDFYYKKALLYANNSNLQAAISSLSLSLGFDKNNSNAIYLCGIIYLELGNYKMAEKFITKDHKNYNLLKQKKIFLKKISFLINNNKYEYATKFILSAKNKSINELNILGCLYALSGDKKMATKVFERSIDRDKFNNQTHRLKNSLNEIKQKWWCKI